jgi:DNA polymerase
MVLSPDTVFICNSDMPLLVKERIRKVLPKVIITLGEEAGRALLGSDFCLKEQRGNFHEFEGIKVMPTFHPSLLLEMPQFKRQVWEDMKLVMEYAGLKNGS